jgi:hypothetical protein
MLVNKVAMRKVVLIFFITLLMNSAGYFGLILFKLCGISGVPAGMASFLIQILAYIGGGIAVAFVPIPKADWHMCFSFLMIGAVCFGFTDYLSFSYISSLLFYGLLIAAISYRVSKKFIRKTSG